MDLEDASARDLGIEPDVRVEVDVGKVVEVVVASVVHELAELDLEVRIRPAWLATVALVHGRQAERAENVETHLDGLRLKHLFEVEQRGRVHILHDPDQALHVAHHPVVRVRELGAKFGAEAEEVFLEWRALEVGLQPILVDLAVLHVFGVVVLLLIHPVARVHQLLPVGLRLQVVLRVVERTKDTGARVLSAHVITDHGVEVHMLCQQHGLGQVALPREANSAAAPLSFRHVLVHRHQARSFLRLGLLPLGLSLGFGLHPLGILHTLMIRDHCNACHLHHGFFGGIFVVIVGSKLGHRTDLGVEVLEARGFVARGVPKALFVERDRALADHGGHETAESRVLGEHLERRGEDRVFRHHDFTYQTLEKVGVVGSRPLGGSGDELVLELADGSNRQARLLVYLGRVRLLVLDFHDLGTVKLELDRGELHRQELVRHHVADAHAEHLDSTLPVLWHDRRWRRQLPADHDLDQLEGRENGTLDVTRLLPQQINPLGFRDREAAVRLRAVGHLSVEDLVLRKLVKAAAYVVVGMTMIASGGPVPVPDLDVNLREEVDVGRHGHVVHHDRAVHERVVVLRDVVFPPADHLSVVADVEVRVDAPADEVGVGQVARLVEMHAELVAHALLRGVRHLLPALLVAIPLVLEAHTEHDEYVARELAVFTLVERLVLTER
mmetsp:Transcript_27518/g.74858  ORF Transcript_27518/g.74858 Transcript_27518/m.74858 type:complete len:669 (+) Transcript_27518:1478-3484(+)